MKINEIIKIYSKKMEGLSETPLLDVKVLLKKALGDVEEYYILIYGNKELTKQQLSLFKCYFEKRLKRIPIAYIIEEKEFMGLNFFVNENVLIPRPDTETIVEDIINKYKNNENKIKMLDLCTGSGAIAISLANYIENVDMTATDLSKEALKVAKKNAVSLNVSDKINFIESNMLEYFKINNEKYKETFDMIVSNPPYIETKVIETLEIDVKKYEPMMALDGGDDGLKFYKIIAKDGFDFIKKGGWLFFEIGHDQYEKIFEIMENCGYKNIYNCKDLQGFKRLVAGQKI